MDNKTKSIKESKQEEVGHQACYQCEGKGYSEIRDCAGEIQRSETCSYCEGKGYTELLISN